MLFITAIDEVEITLAPERRPRRAVGLSAAHRRW
jgi:hypothetical protein